MESRRSSPSRRAESPRPSTSRQRSNSLPIVEALGCSTPEAKLLLAEGTAAIRSRRTRGRRNRSDNMTAFDPRDHLEYLSKLAALPTPQEHPVSSLLKFSHTRIPSNATDGSTSTVIPQLPLGESHTSTSPASPLGDYSATLAAFIKAQLKSIPTYQDGTSPLSPRSCPDLSFQMGSPPSSPKRLVRRPSEAPKMIEIPSIRPPMLSTFSAWSSTDDDTDDEASSLPNLYTNDTISKWSTYTPLVPNNDETSHEASFLFSSTPLEEKSEPSTAKGFTFPNQSALPGAKSEPHNDDDDDDDYPSSSVSHPQLISSSAPSYISSASTSSYFDYKRPLVITPQMTDRIIAAVTPPFPQGKTFTAVSPWEGAAISSVHDVLVESQHRVRVDGLSFDMLGDFLVPSRATTPC